MDSFEDRKREQQFLNAWKIRAQQQPRLSPGEAAARVVGRLPKRSPSRPWWLLAAAAVVLSAALTVHWATLSRRTTQTGTGIDLQQSPAMSEGEVLIWLDDKTPLYMTFQPPEALVIH